MILKTRALSLFLAYLLGVCLVLGVLLFSSQGHSDTYLSGTLRATAPVSVLEPGKQLGSWSPGTHLAASEDLALSGGPELLAHLKSFRLSLRVLYPVLAVGAITFPAQAFCRTFPSYRILPNAP